MNRVPVTLPAVLCGGAREVLRNLPSEAFNCCVTSPPYWGLRDYGVEGVDWPSSTYFPMAGAPCVEVSAWRGCLGLEPTPELYVAHLLAIFREVRRTLRRDGTLWLVLGDSYNANGRSGHGVAVGRKQQTTTAYMTGSDWCRPSASELKAKDLVGIPWRVALALQADGWYLRSDVIFAKDNPMPESVRDRCTRSHEHVFLLSRSEQYHYDQDAVAERCVGENHHDVTGPGYSAAGQTPHRGDRNAARSTIRSTRNRRDVWQMPTNGSCWRYCTRCETLYEGADYRSVKKRGKVRVCPGCGATNDWVVHSAQYPEPLVELCLLAGCPEGGVVLDPFGGGGTTGIVAAQNGRRYVMMDVSPGYCAAMRARIDWRSQQRP